MARLEEMQLEVQAPRLVATKKRQPRLRIEDGEGGMRRA